jgi:anti-sigma regulatory factor (Ser/Thr protein kinase)
VDLLIRIEPQTQRLHCVRRVIDVWLQCHDVRAEATQLVATELLTNAFAVTPPGGRVEMELRRTPGTIELSVTDRGPGFDPDVVGRASPDGLQGRGLLIVRDLADQVLVRRVADATVITASFDVEHQDVATPSGE